MLKEWMDHFLLIFLCLVLGHLCRLSPKFPKSTAQGLNAFVIYISFPALVIEQVPKLIATLEFGPELLIPISMAWLLFFMSFGLFWTLGKYLGWEKKQVGALILTAGLANTSFVGFPLLEALVGSQAIKIGIIVDQLGTFLTCSTFGLVVAGMCAAGGDGVISRARIVRSIVFFPPFIALVLTAGISFLGISLPLSVTHVAQKISLTLVPLALFAVGFALNINRETLGQKWRLLCFGLTFKLLAAPFIFMIIYRLILGARGEVVLVTLLESAMAPMITSAVIANEFELDGELANLMVGIGIPISLVSVWGWHYFLSTL